MLGMGSDPNRSGYRAGHVTRYCTAGPGKLDIHPCCCQLAIDFRGDVPASLFFGEVLCSQTTNPRSTKPIIAAIGYEDSKLPRKEYSAASTLLTLCEDAGLARPGSSRPGAVRRSTRRRFHAPLHALFLSRAAHTQRH